MLTTSAAFAAGAVPASAAVSRFDGSCQFEGVSRYDQPMTREVTDNVSRSFATGSCRGTLNGVRHDESLPVESATEVPFRGSCYEQAPRGRGRGYLRFTHGSSDERDDVVITFTMTFTSDPVLGVDYEFRGDLSGTGRGRVEYTNASTPQAVLACETSGLKESPFTASSYTEGPLASLQPDPAAPAGAPPSTSTGRIVSTDLGRALRRGVQVRCRVPGAASCRFAIYVDRATARRYGLRSRRLGEAEGSVPAGARSATAIVRLGRSAQRRLAGARSLRLHLLVVVSKDGTSGAVRTSKRLHRR